MRLGFESVTDPTRHEDSLFDDVVESKGCTVRAERV